MENLLSSFIYIGPILGIVVGYSFCKYMIECCMLAVMEHGKGWMGIQNRE